MSMSSQPIAAQAGTAHRSLAERRTAREGYAAKVRADQLRSFCQQAVRIPLGVTILVGYILYLLWHHAPHDQLVAWGVLVCGALLARTGVSMRLLRRALTPEEVERWTRRMIVFSFFNGTFGGLAALLFFAAAPLPEKAILTMLMAAWGAAAITTSGMMPKSFYAYIVPFLLPVVFGWARVEDYGGPFVAVLLVAFGVYLVLFVRDTGRMMERALRTGYENVALVAELRAKQTEAEGARDRAELANRAKTQFLAVASHDLRQPLTALSLFNRLLSESARDPEVQRLARHIDASVTSLEQLMAALLDISKLDAGSVEPNRGAVALAEIFGRLEAQYAPLAAQRSLALLAEKTDEWVDTDPVLLERIIRNLVENALRYTREGAIRIRAARSGSRVAIEVEDSGIGIPHAERQRIFEEFYQVAGNERAPKQGLGLGLAIVHRLVQLLGCTIEVDSSIGRGSTFRVLVPRAEQLTKSAEPARPLPTMARPELGGIKVVVLDDEESILIAMKALLDSWGCETRVASSTADASAAFTAPDERPDLILADYRLRNGETGIDLVRAAQARWGRVPAILMTGDTAPDWLREATQSGLPIVHKPISPELLRDEIERVLELRAA